MKSEPRIILGIDPGSNITGYAVISIQNDKIKINVCGEIKLGRFSEDNKKWQKLFETCMSIILQYNVNEFAIEAPFYGKNVQSMLKLGRAQGIAIATAVANKINVNEYSPRKVKQSITGKGSGSKEQVAAMLQHLTGIKDMPTNLDATDALGVAVCHYFQKNPATKGASYNSWKAFARENPGRMK